MRPEALMKTGDVAKLFKVHGTTVRRWGAAGKLTEVRTLGGQRRFRRKEVYALYRNLGGGAGKREIDRLFRELGGK